MLDLYAGMCRDLFLDVYMLISTLHEQQAEYKYFLSNTISGIRHHVFNSGTTRDLCNKQVYNKTFLMGYTHYIYFKLYFTSCQY